METRIVVVGDFDFVGIGSLRDREATLAADLEALGRDFDVLDLARGSGNRQPVFAHAFEVKLDRFADLGYWGDEVPSVLARQPPQRR